MKNGYVITSKIQSPSIGFTTRIKYFNGADRVTYSFNGIDLFEIKRFHIPIRNKTTVKLLKK